MRAVAWLVCAMGAAYLPPLALAQTQKPAPVEERSGTAASPQQLQQQRASASYRDVTQAAFESKLAEQDVLNLQDAYNAARERADGLKAELDKALKARETARFNEAAARKRYEEALK
jgi:hypothetical protein